MANLHEHQQKILDWLDTPEGKQHMSDYVANLVKEQERVEKCKDRYDAMTNEEFKKLVITEAANQDWSYGAEMSQEIKDITRVMVDYGKVFKPKKEIYYFAVQYSRYKGLTAILFVGQGSFVKVKSGKKVILQS